MKRVTINHKTAAVVFAVLTLAAALFGTQCRHDIGGTGGRTDGRGTLSEETERRILQDFVGWLNKLEPGSVSVLYNTPPEYYGAYNGWVVVRVQVSHPVVEHVTIGGFRFYVMEPIIAWKNGQIHELKDAYDLGFLTQDDIISIAKYSGTLSAELAGRILQDFADYEDWDKFHPGMIQVI